MTTLVKTYKIKNYIKKWFLLCDDQTSSNTRCHIDRWEHHIIRWVQHLPRDSRAPWPQVQFPDRSSPSTFAIWNKKKIIHFTCKISVYEFMIHISVLNFFNHLSVLSKSMELDFQKYDWLNMLAWLNKKSLDYFFLEPC